MVLELNRGVVTLITVRGFSESNLEVANKDGNSVLSKYFSYIYITYMYLTLGLFFFHFAQFP